MREEASQNGEGFKMKLARVFDENLHTRQWHNYIDYLIITMIIISTVEIFLSTYNLSRQTRRILFWIDIITLLFFTIEVTLRIWVAPYIDLKYKGLKGRLKYCFSFHGFIDCVSTYPYYLQWIVPFPIAWVGMLRLSRVLRLFRVSRYMKSWNLLKSAIQEKRRELFISMQFLIVVTIILSLLLFFAEHEAQPDIYDNGFSSVMWAFAQYIGDPGGFGSNPPITVIGKIIACVVGLLGIAIVAVPAGILGAGFTEAIEKESNKEQLETNRKKLQLSFERKLDRPTGYQVVPPYRTIAHIQSRLGMTEDEIINTVSCTPGFRMVNLAATIPVDKNPQDNLAVEHFEFNRPYGCMMDRNSKITIVAPSSFVDDCTGFFAWYLAEIGGFNFISREFGTKVPYKSFYILSDDSDEDYKEEYLSDIENFASREGNWMITFLVASGANEPEYETQIHFGTGNPKGDESVGDLIHEKEKYLNFYQRLHEELKNTYDIKCDNGRYHSSASPNLFYRKIKKNKDSNFISMRMAWSMILWDSRRIKIAETIAGYINRFIVGTDGNPDNSKLRIKDIGYK